MPNYFLKKKDVISSVKKAANKTVKFDQLKFTARMQWPKSQPECSGPSHSQSAVVQLDEQQVQSALSPKTFRTAEIDPLKQGKVICLMFHVLFGGLWKRKSFFFPTGIRPAPEESVENRREDQVRLIKQWLTFF